MSKGFILFILLVAGLVIYQRSKFTHEKFLHYSAESPITPVAENRSSFYQIGAFQHVPALSFGEKFSRKKINNYLFIVNNEHKIEIALIDLGYISVLNANYFGKGQSFSFQEKSIFNLQENFNNIGKGINKVSGDFRLVFNQVKQSRDGINVMVSNFDVFVKRSDGQYTLKLTHYQPEDRCVTYVRSGVVSYKCYGGYTEGFVDLLVKGTTTKGFEKALVFGKNNSTAAFDGFRASGWEWTWVWGMGAGINSFGEHIGINVGHIKTIGQDFLYAGSKIIPLQGFKYILNENLTIGDSISCTASNPKLAFEFKITVKQHKYQDLGVLKSDMVKFEGYWSGTYEDPQTLNVVTIRNFPGLLETADSIF